MKLETVPDAPLNERELDGELQAAHDKAMEILLAAASVESARRAGDSGGEDEFMKDVRIAAQSIIYSVDNAARCAGELLHGDQEGTA